MSEEPLYCYRKGEGWVPVPQDDTIYYQDINGKVWRVEERIPCPGRGEPWTAILKGATLAEHLSQWTNQKLVPGSPGTLYYATPPYMYHRYFAFVAV